MEVNSVQIGRAKFEEIVDLRYAVLRGLPREAAFFPGDDAPTTVHFAAWDDGIVIGCATIMLNTWQDSPAYQLRGMAVAPTHQSRGIGQKILLELEQVATENEVPIIWANARVPAANFYRKNGWEIASDEFDIPTAGPHYKMTRELSGS